MVVIDGELEAGGQAEGVGVAWALVNKVSSGLSLWASIEREQWDTMCLGSQLGTGKVGENWEAVTLDVNKGNN